MTEVHVLSHLSLSWTKCAFLSFDAEVKENMLIEGEAAFLSLIELEKMNIKTLTN